MSRDAGAKVPNMDALAGFGSGSTWSATFLAVADRAFMLALFALVVLALLGLLALGSTVYGTLAEDRSDAAALRQETGLFLNIVRSGDSANAVERGEGPEGPALVLKEYLDSGTYETRIYAHEGAIVQEYAVEGDAYDPAAATRIADSQSFDFSYDEETCLLTIRTDAGETRVALRSEQ